MLCVFLTLLCAKIDCQNKFEKVGYRKILNDCQKGGWDNSRDSLYANFRVLSFRGVEDGGSGRLFEEVDPV